MRSGFVSLICLASVLAVNASSQTIEVGELESASAYDVGVLSRVNGGLDQNLWRGTLASRAVYLLKSVVPVGAETPSQVFSRDLVRAVVLSGGVPPSTETFSEAPSVSSSDFAHARIAAILDLGEMAAAQSIVARTPTLSEDNLLQADIALLSGNNDAACLVADRVLEGRSQPNWARLRAFCHVLRGETPAAEVTTDILRAAGYEDPAYYSLMRMIGGATGKPDLKSVRADDALHVALMAKASLDWPTGTGSKVLAARQALTDVADPKARLAAIYAAGPALSDTQIEQVFSALADIDRTEGGESDASEQSPDGSTPVDPRAVPKLPTLNAAMNAPFPQGTAQLYMIAKSGPQVDRPGAMAELLRRASMNKAFERIADLLAADIKTLSPEEQAITDLPLFVRAAVRRRDIPVLQAIHGVIADRPEVQARIALIADALGYGFIGGPLGIDIETRLEGDGKVKAGAERDVFVALAMGATLSSVSSVKIDKLGKGQGAEISPGLKIGLQSAARAGATAETALWAARILKGEPLNNEGLYTVISALSRVGLTDFAGRLAAEHFLTDLE